MDPAPNIYNLRPGMIFRATRTKITKILQVIHKFNQNKFVQFNCY